MANATSPQKPDLSTKSGIAAVLKTEFQVRNIKWDNLDSLINNSLERIFGDKEQIRNFSYKEENLTKVVDKALADRKMEIFELQHPLGNYAFYNALNKLLIQELSVENENPEKAKKKLTDKHKASLKDLILSDHKKPTDQRSLPATAILCEEQNLWFAERFARNKIKDTGINQERFDALYDALGSADAQKYAAALHIKPIALVDAEGYATTPENIAVIAQKKTLEHDSLSSPKITKAALEATVETLFKKLPKDTTAKISADDIEAVVADFAANLEQEYTNEDGKKFKGSLGKGGQLYVFEKLFIEALTITPAEQEITAKEALTKDLKGRIKEDILDPKITYLEKEDFLGLVVTEKKKKDKIDEDKFDTFFETIGTSNIEAGWEIATPAAQPSQEQEQASDHENPKTKKTGFAAASTSTKLGMVGTAALGIGLLATSGQKEPEPGQEHEKQSNFWPNVKKFLGIAALLGAGIWAWKVSQQGKSTSVGIV